MDEYNALGFSSSVLSSGEKHKMVCDSNDIFVKLMKNLQQEHAEELRNNRIHNNKLYYTRQDYSKNEKKLKRSEQYLADLQEELLEKKGSVVLMSGKVSRMCAEKILQKGSLVEEKIEHQRLCAEREEHTKLFNFGQMFARKVGEEKDYGKSKIRLFVERVFGLKESQQKQLDIDVNAILSCGGNAKEFRHEVIDVLKEIESSSGKVSRLAKLFKKKKYQTNKLIQNTITRLEQ